ncbi:MAG: hypothetical protein GX417_05470 [Clostridiales bacterium]|nr:hypothetical protein [Clostridiales bacterium]
MKEHRTHRRAGGLRRRARRTLAIVIALILTLALSATALADNGKNDGTPGERPGQSDKTTSDTKPGNRYGNRNAEMTGLNVDKIEEAIAALTDEDAKASLTELLNAYIAAFDARQAAVEAKETDELNDLAEAMATAKAALDAALEAAGISTDTLYGVPEEANDGTGRINSNKPALDTDEIAAAIAALTDEDAKASLTELLSAYQAALAAEQNADGSLTQDELKALSDATKAAEQALLEATKAAGVTGGVGRGQFVNGYAYGNAVLNMEAIAAQIAGLDDADANKAVLTQLMEAYQAAFAAEQGADASALTEEELGALSDATKAAEKALMDALENAGLDVPTQNQQQGGEEYQMRIITDENGSASEAAGGLFASFWQWLGSLFQ